MTVSTLSKQFTITCPYCHRPALRVNGRRVYPHRPDLARRWFYQCEPCQAHVGCHRRAPHKPLGTLAKPALRRARSQAHAVFDPLWRKGAMTRDEAYEWLSRQLELPVDDCHIGQFDMLTCQRVLMICAKAQRAVTR